MTVLNQNTAGNHGYVPKGSWDSHVHVMEPQVYPYAASRAYSPTVATYTSLLKFNASISATNMPQNLVLVQPSPYGFDNSCILDILRTHSAIKDNTRQLRAITVFDPERITDRELKEWNLLGVRGFRINEEASSDSSGVEQLKIKILKTVQRVSEYKHWKCQLFISGSHWDGKHCSVLDLKNLS
jgi:predicted TIM-barrel fold metal-dependent hydrolase